MLISIADWMSQGFLDLMMILIVVLEFLGALIIAYGAVVIFVRFFLLKYRQSSTDIRIRFARTLLLALEFFLASEILKTVTVHQAMELITVGVIIVLRTIIAVFVHWEMKNDLECIQSEDVTAKNIEKQKS